MHISNFRPVKRVRDVVRIFARVARRDAGRARDGRRWTRAAAAEEEARTLGVTDSVFFLGKIDAVAPLLAGADVFLLPTEKESFGLSALEALASGTPVVGSDAGGLPEVVANGDTGLLYPVGDVESMAAGVLSIITDDARASSDAPGWRRRRARAILARRCRLAVRATVSLDNQRISGQPLIVPTTFQALVLGLLQGLAEFLPVSSSAHLALAPWHTRMARSRSLVRCRTALRHARGGAVVFPERVGVTGPCARRRSSRRAASRRSSRSGAAFLVVATIPGGIAGLLLEKKAESAFRNPAIIATALIVMGVVLWIVDRAARADRTINSMTWRDAILIGVAQIFALIPGVSRSGSTITAGERWESIATAQRRSAFSSACRSSPPRRC